MTTSRVKKSKSVTLGLIQMKCSADPDANMAKAVSAIGQAVKRDAQIICLQELFRSVYFCDEEDRTHFKLAEKIPGASTAVFQQIAKTRKVVIIAPLFEKRAQGIFHNTAVVIDADGTILGKYRKMHIPDDPGYYEKFYFTPGDLGFSAYDTRYGRVGVCICWDQWFPEAARLTALQGAQIIFYPTAIGWNVDEKPSVNVAQHSAWETVQRSHAIANGIFVAAVNRVGREADQKFWGQSFVADPSGRVIARASAEKEEILYVDCDLAKIDEIREHWPFLRDRRIDAYGDLTKRFIDKR
ncbi:MAG: carbon-nitrogen hydrolase [Candidatus Omnitrophica bacterium]|nr:carbon-nitrogen hydrolase [Candidatus Omnitrophota bacterium]